MWEIENFWQDCKDDIIMTKSNEEAEVYFSNYGGNLLVYISGW